MEAVMGCHGPGRRRKREIKAHVGEKATEHGEQKMDHAVLREVLIE